MAAGRSAGPKGKVVEPGRFTPVPAREERSPVGGGSEHTLDARSIMDSFSALGVICGVVGPTPSPTETMRQADVVILDWVLQADDPRYALGLLLELLTGEVDRNALRLVAIYTGEARLEDICEEIFAATSEAGLDPKKNESRTVVAYGHGRVVLYAKPAVNLAGSMKARSVDEKRLPERLIDDFAEMTEGLLPAIALASLTAVREGAHRVLDRFCADLDPAFLAHRACISSPEDAERQMVNHVAEELRGLMDNAVADQSPAGADAVKGWIERRSRDSGSFTFGKHTLDSGETITLATEGLDASKLKNNAFQCLSGGFAGGDSADLDERLAWIMSFRTVFNAPPPTLWLGSVVTQVTDGPDRHLICMRPRCDCVRLKEETSFFFLPLVEPRKEMEQLVARLGNEFRRLGIGLDPAGWVFLRFKPSESGTTVTATKRGSDGAFEFTDTDSKRYTWQGELKAEYAQRIAQTLATTLSRVAVDESEWLRRTIKSS